jgi:hypothetical protein
VIRILVNEYRLTINDDRQEEAHGRAAPHGQQLLHANGTDALKGIVYRPYCPKTQ